MRYKLTILASLGAFGQVIDPNAQPKPGYRLEMKRGLLVPGTSAVEKESGDEVAVTPDGSIVARSRSRSFTFPATNRMEPEIQASYALNNDRLQYDYVVSNGAGAVNNIETFELVISSPADVAASEPWRSLRVEKPGAAPALGFYRLARDDDQRGRLSPGVIVRGIRIVSDYAPGLVAITFRSNAVPRANGLLNAGEFFNTASPWVQQRLLALDTPDRHRLRGLVIGPVALLKMDSLEGIQQEIQTAAQWPQLAVLQRLISQSPIPQDLSSLTSWLTDLKKESPDRIVLDFVDAMGWRLRRLQ